MLGIITIDIVTAELKQINQVKEQKSASIHYDKMISEKHFYNHKIHNQS